MPLITVRGPSGPPVSYHFDKDVVTVGRSPANDLIVSDPSISRLHLEIRRREQGWTVADRGSSNGTLLNGDSVTTLAVLKPGSEIGLGETTLVFDTPVEEAIMDGSELPTTPLPWSSRGTGSGDEEPAFIGECEAIRAILDTLERVARSDASVLITGENGTGKELIARLIHQGSPRRAGPFVVANCPALPESLLEAELFGVEKGVATGVEARIGRVESAQGGTLLLDEIGDMDPAAQAKILRFLEDRTVERLGGREPIDLDVRILAATNHDLEADMKAGSFRRDLYHRLNVVTLSLPPLRERREDIPLLVEHFLSTAPGPRFEIGPDARDLLRSYDYPGNVRELEHILESARILARGGRIDPEDLPGEVRSGRAPLDPSEAAPDEVAGDLRYRIIEGGESFWDLVQEPYLRRELSREPVRRFVEVVYGEAGGSYREMARLLGIEDQYRKLLNFLYFHGLRPGK